MYVRCSNVTITEFHDMDDGDSLGPGSGEYWENIASTCEKCHQDHGECSVDCKWSYGPKGAKKCIHKNFSENFFNLNHNKKFSSKESLEVEYI